MSTTLLDSFPQTLAERIEQAVQTRTGGRIRGLCVRVDEGDIIISGRTSTYYNKQLATHAAMDAADELLLLVVNEVEVC